MARIFISYPEDTLIEDVLGFEKVLVESNHTARWACDEYLSISDAVLFILPKMVYGIGTYLLPENQKSHLARAIDQKKHVLIGYKRRMDGKYQIYLPSPCFSTILHGNQNVTESLKDLLESPVDHTLSKGCMETSEASIKVASLTVSESSDTTLSVEQIREISDKIISEAKKILNKDGIIAAKKAAKELTKNSMDFSQFERPSDTLERLTTSNHTLDAYQEHLSEIIKKGANDLDLQTGLHAKTPGYFGFVYPKPRLSSYSMIIEDYSIPDERLLLFF